MSTDQFASLEAELRALAPRLDFAPTPDLASAVSAQLRARPSVQRRAARWWNAPRTSAIAAGIIALLAAILVLSPGAREAVASIFRGVRGIRIVVDNGRSSASPSVVSPTTPASPSAPAVVSPTTPVSPTTTVSPTTPASPSSPAPQPTTSSPEASATSLPPAPAIPGTETTLDAVRTRIAFTPLLPPPLGPPDRVLLEDDVANGMVTIVWKSTPSLPAAAGDIGAILTQFKPGISDDFPYWLKSVQSEARLQQAQVNGNEATWVEGGHRLDFRIPDPAGWTQLASSRIAANTLLWTQNGVTVRLETALSRAAAIRLAETMR